MRNVNFLNLCGSFLGTFLFPKFYIFIIFEMIPYVRLITLGTYSLIFMYIKNGSCGFWLRVRIKSSYYLKLFIFFKAVAILPGCALSFHILKYIILFFVCVGVLPACMSVCSHPKHAFLGHSKARRGLEMELPIVFTCYVGAGNWTRVPLEDNSVFLTNDLISNP